MSFKTRARIVVLQQHFKEARIAVLVTLGMAFGGGATQIWDLNPAMRIFHDLVHA
jgi:hypothetical protein